MPRAALLVLILAAALSAPPPVPFAGDWAGAAWAQDDGDDDDDDDDDGGDDDDDGGDDGGGGTGGSSPGGDGGSAGAGADDDAGGNDDAGSGGDDGSAGSDDGGGDDGGGTGGGATGGGGNDDAGGGQDDDDDDDSPSPGAGTRGSSRESSGGTAQGQRRGEGSAGQAAGRVQGGSDRATALRGPRIDTRRGAGDRSRRGEISGLDLSRAELQRLVDAGFTLIEVRPLGTLASGAAARLRPPGRLRDQAALDLARSLVPEAVFDLSHLYGASQGATLYAPDLVRFAPERSCGTGIRLGMVDGAVANHPMLQGARITRKSFTTDNASAAHGTAVASVLVGRDPSGRALLRNAALFAAAVFTREGGETAADAIDVAAALDWLARQGVGVVNLSIAGPENALLAETVMRAARGGMIMVAAAGNGGAGGKPRYPAAYPEVIAVSAIDARGRPYRNNTRGSYIDIAAPGVDIWAADARNASGALWSGTSFAAPFVTVELAVARQSGAVRSAAGAHQYLARNARDLGSAGPDSVFGQGLIQSAACR